MSTPAENFWTKVYPIISFFSIVFIVHNLCTTTPHLSRCGKVEKKLIAQDVDINKSVATVNYNEYFIVHFDDGNYEKVKVSTNNFYKYQESSRICFPVEPKLTFTHFLTAVICYGLTTINIIALFIFGVGKFNEYLNE